MRSSLFRRLVPSAAIAALGALGCGEVGTNPTVPVSIMLLPPALPSLVVGDSLRDSTGRAAPLRAVVFNSRNDTIQDAPVRYLSLDSARLVSLDPNTGYIVGKDTGSVRVIASAGSLQTPILRIPIVEPPTALLPHDSLVYTFNFKLTLGATAAELPLQVRLVHVRGTDTIPVPNYLVRYAFEYPPEYSNADSTKIQLVDGSKRPALRDTTRQDGASSLALRITPFASAARDSVKILVSAARPDATPVPGSPIRFVVHYTIE